jgi:ferredoxin--NADP+ reductase
MPELNATVTQRLDIAPGLMIIRVAPLDWTLPAFKPGQFAVLGLPGDAPRSATSFQEEEGAGATPFIRRAYSIASSSKEREFLEFYIVEVRSGALTPRLFALEEGDSLWLGPKITGLFTLDAVPPEQNVAFIATGTGLAPYMSMLRTHLEAGPSRHMAVIHGARSTQDLGYREELFHLQRDHALFSYLPVITRPKKERVPWHGAVGHLQDYWASTPNPLEQAWGFQPKPEDTHFFLCGNPDMVEEMAKLLGRQGFNEHTRKNPGQIHFEKYW